MKSDYFTPYSNEDQQLWCLLLRVSFSSNISNFCTTKRNRKNIRLNNEQQSSENSSVFEEDCWDVHRTVIFPKSVGDLVYSVWISYFKIEEKDLK